MYNNYYILLLFYYYSKTSLRVLDCNVSNDCVPYEYSIYDISPFYISCFHNVCLCMYCFTADPMTGICQLNDCFGFYPFEAPGGAYYDNRLSQKTTFLLSFFLSPVGAANFHIGQWKLGVIQISLSVFLLILIIWCCCTSCRLPDEDSNHVSCTDIDRIPFLIYNFYTFFICYFDITCVFFTIVVCLYILCYLHDCACDHCIHHYTDLVAGRPYIHWTEPKANWRWV